MTPADTSPSPTETVQRRIAKIESTHLGFHDGSGSILTAYLYVAYGGGLSQGIGGYALDRYDTATKDRIGTAYGCEWIRRVLDACGVEQWEDLPGRTIYVLQKQQQTYLGSTGAVGIAPLETEPGTEFIFDDLTQMAEMEEQLR